VLVTEIFLNPFIEEHSFNEALIFSAKVLIYLLLKPMKALYERILFRKTLKAKTTD